MAAATASAIVVVVVAAATAKTAAFAQDGGYRQDSGFRQDSAPRGPAQSVEGAVKWFEPDKGYGFISPDGGGKDIFVHITALRRSGVQTLGPGQRVRVDVVDGRKGLEAERVVLL